MGKIFYKIFNIGEETVEWWSMLEYLNFSNVYMNDYVVIYIVVFGSDDDSSTLGNDYNYDVNILEHRGQDVKNRLDELIRIDKIGKILN